MPLKFWDEAFIAATYLINRLPSKVIASSTPLERLFHQKPNYSALLTFGCACWPNLRPYNTHKLQFRSKQCVFLGYSVLHKGFKCLDVSSGRVYISRDVTFDENVFPFAKLHPNAGARLRPEILLLPSETTANPGASDIADQSTNMPVSTVKNFERRNSGYQENPASNDTSTGRTEFQEDSVETNGATPSAPGSASTPTSPSGLRRETHGP